jgi:hypothetical protein
MLFTLALLLSLEPGRHAVGYETHFVRDHSRPAAIGSGARTVQVSVWYPAEARKADLRLRDYIHLLGRYDGAPRTAATDRAGVERFVATVKDLSAESPIDRHLDDLLALETRAARNATRKRGPFPLVVFPDYRAPATNSFLAELLASYGFVVAAVPIVGTHELDFDTGVTGIETLVADIRVAIDEIGRRGLADTSRLGLIGVGIAANASIAYIARNSGVDAMVSLDGGLASPFEDSLLRRGAYYEPAAFRTPLLLIEAPYEGMNRGLLDQYRFADRWFVTLPKMKEHHFLNYGPLEAVAPRLIGAPPERVQEGWEWAARAVRAFFDAKLHGRGEPLASVPEGLGETRFERGRTSVPAPQELKRVLREGGAAAGATLWERIRRDEPRPYTTETLIAMSNWFGWGRDADVSIRRFLATMIVDAYPDSARGHQLLANACRERRERECAREHYEAAMRLIAADPDPIDGGARQRIAQAAKRRLDELAR